MGKGRKARSTPLSAQAVEVLRVWLQERKGQPEDGDWPEYYCYHLAQEHRRAHESRYAGGVIPHAA